MSGNTIPTELFSCVDKFFKLLTEIEISKVSIGASSPESATFSIITSLSNVLTCRSRYSPRFLTSSELLSISIDPQQNKKDFFRDTFIVNGTVYQPPHDKNDTLPSKCLNGFAYSLLAESLASRTISGGLVFEELLSYYPANEYSIAPLSSSALPIEFLLVENAERVLCRAQSVYRVFRDDVEIIRIAGNFLFELSDSSSSDDKNVVASAVIYLAEETK